MAIILGMNIRQAACQGMIDNTILAAYTDSLQPSTAPKASAKDENLFVSDDENEISAPQLQINGVTLEDIDSDDSLSNYSDGSNHSKPASQDRPFTDDGEVGEDETQITEPLKSQPSEPKEKFSSLFGTSMQLPSASTSSQIPFSPFAFLSAPAGSSPMNGQSSPNTNAPPSVNSTNTGVFSLPKTDKAPSTAVSGQIEPAESSVLDLKPTFSIAAAISNATPPMSNPEDVKSVGIFDKMKMGTNPQNPPIISFNTPGPMQSTEQKPNHAPNLTPKLKEASQPIANSANGVSTQLSGSSLLAESSPAEPLIPKRAHSSTKEKTGSVASGPDQSNFSLGDNPLVSTGHALQNPMKSLGSVKGTQVQTSADEFSSPASYFSTESKESLLDKRELMEEGLTGKCLSSSFFFFFTVVSIFHFVPLSSNRRFVPVTTLNWNTR